MSATPTTKVVCPYHEIPFVFRETKDGRNLFECFEQRCHYLLSSPIKSHPSQDHGHHQSEPRTGTHP